MERLTLYGYGEILILVLLAGFVLIAQSAALCWAFTHLSRRRICHLLPETAALAVILLTTLLLGGAWKLFFAGLSPLGWLAAERWIAGLLALVVGLTACERRLLPALLLAFAGLCSLPMMDDFLPMNAALVLLLLGVRLVLLAMRAYAQDAHGDDLFHPRGTRPPARGDSLCPRGSRCRTRQHRHAALHGASLRTSVSERRGVLAGAYGV